MLLSDFTVMRWWCDYTTRCLDLVFSSSSSRQSRSLNLCHRRWCSSSRNSNLSNSVQDLSTLSRLCLVAEAVQAMRTRECPVGQTAATSSMIQKECAAFSSETLTAACIHPQLNMDINSNFRDWWLLCLNRLTESTLLWQPFVVVVLQRRLNASDLVLIVVDCQRICSGECVVYVTVFMHHMGKFSSEYCTTVFEWAHAVL